MQSKVSSNLQRVLLWAACVVVTLTAGAVPAMGAETSGAASETVRSTVEKVRAKVAEQQGSAPPEALDVQLREIIAPVFDFEEMSRRSLGANWRKATPEQRKEFVSLFSDLLARNYLKKIRENVADSEFKLLGENNNGKKSLVKTSVIYDGEEASIDYRLLQKDGAWRVYDVVIENIGLVSNYRSEFAGIINKEDIDGLLTRLREKK